MMNVHRAVAGLDSERRPGAVRRRLPELLLAASSVALVLALVAAAELGARWSAPGPADGPSADALYDGHAYSERLGWEPRAGARFVLEGAPTTINAFGFRGAPVPREPRPGRVRVLFLGDSVAFGYGVADHQTFAHLLDGAETGFESVNLAVPGYGVDQSLLRYELSGSQWRPRLVVLNICLANDLADIMLPAFLYDGRHPKPRFEQRGAALELHDRHLRLGRHQRLAQWLGARSRLYRLLTRRRPAAAPVPAEHWMVRRERAVEDTRAAVRLMAALVGRLRRALEADGARLVLAFHPDEDAYRQRPPWMQRLVRRPELAGVQVVCLRDAYRRRETAFDDIALDEVGHLNPSGHRLAALVLRDALAQPAPPVVPAREGQ
jgi:hypothetical protein